MPWIPYCKPPGETPAHYSWLRGVLSDDTVLGRNIEYAKGQRKKSMQFREEAAEAQKEFRGWDSAIKIIEGDNDYWHGHIAEPIAPYVDRAFEMMEYG